MSRKVRVRLCGLRSSLVNLPPSLASQLSSQGILPQSLGIRLTKPSREASKTGTPSCLYVGWTGLTTAPAATRDSLFEASLPPSRHTAGLWSDSANLSDKNAWDFAQTIELDEALGAEMGWKNNDTLELKFYHRELGRARTVNVEPVGVDDWEILESNPQYLEEHFLSQVRVLAEAQTLLVWLYGKTLIRVKVTSIELPQSNSAHSGSLGNPCLITNETEIVVSPKTRQASLVDTSNEPGQMVDKTFSSDVRKEKLTASQLKQVTLKILPHSYPLNDPDGETPREAGNHLQTADTLQRQHGDVPVAEINPVQFARFETLFPTTLCSLKLIIRPNQGLISRTPPSLPRPSEVESSSRGLLSKSLRSDQGRALSPSFSPHNVGDRVRLVPSSRVPSGFVNLPHGFRHKWFSSLSIDLVQPLSISLARPGDYEFIRIEAVKQSSPDSLSPDPKNRDLSPVEESRASQLKSSTLPGFDQHTHFCMTYVQNTLATGALFTVGQYRTGNQKLAGLMIYGSSGSGKTSLIKSIMQKVYLDRDLMLYARYVDCGKHVEDRLGALKSQFTEWFDDAVWHSPSLLVLDDLDKLLPAEAEHVDSFRYRHFTEEFISTAHSAIKDKIVILVATSSSAASIHPLLASTTHLFSETLSLKGLNPEGREQILRRVLESKASSSGLIIDDLDAARIMKDKTEGYLPSDLKDLVDGAVHQAIIRSLKHNSSGDVNTPTMVTLGLQDFEQAQRNFTPVSLRDVKLHKSNVSWSDIGGLSETKRILRETLEWPTKHASLFKSCPLRLCSGLLLYGYPGCGKTLLASAVAKECGLNFIGIKGPELLNKYIGASEKSVRDLFDRAQVARPCVLFFDEFESIAPKRGHDSTGVTDRVVNQLLTEMDGAEGLEGVYVLAATSRPDLIDPALLRPGRLDKSLLCSMPTEKDRFEILEAVSRTLLLDGSVEFEEVAKVTEGFTGADLQALIYSAHLKVVHESIKVTTLAGSADMVQRIAGGQSPDELKWVELTPRVSKHLQTREREVKSRAEDEAKTKMIEVVLSNSRTKTSSLPNGVRPTTSNQAGQNRIESRHIFSALADTRPSVPKNERARLGDIYRKFVSSRSDGGLPNGAASELIGGRASLM